MFSTVITACFRSRAPRAWKFLVYNAAVLNLLVSGVICFIINDRDLNMFETLVCKQIKNKSVSAPPVPRTKTITELSPTMSFIEKPRYLMLLRYC